MRARTLKGAGAAPASARGPGWKSTTPPAGVAAMASRRDPAPLSARVVTVLGVQRDSSASSKGRTRQRGLASLRRDDRPPELDRDRNRPGNAFHIM